MDCFILLKDSPKEFISVFSAALKTGKDIQVHEEITLPFALTVVRAFGFLKEPDKRIAATVQECQEARKNARFQKLCHEWDVCFLKTPEEIISSLSEPEENISNAANFFVYVSDPALQIRVMTYAMDVIEDICGLKIHHTAWEWRKKLS